MWVSARKTKKKKGNEKKKRQKKKTKKKKRERATGSECGAPTGKQRDDTKKTQILA
jgi:hypothetical protein